MTALLLMREDRAAEALGLSPRTLQRWRVEGRGPAYHKLGRKVVGYTEADLRAFIERSHKETAESRNP